MTVPFRTGWGRRLAAAFALFAAAACGGDAEPTAPTPLAAAPDGAAFAISDGARNGGLQGFYFIAPIAPAAPYPGTFDPARQPVVEVCRWSGTACVGAPVATYSVAARSVTVSAAEEAYRATWPVAGAARGQLYRVRVLEQGVPLGHADAKIPGPGETAAGLKAQQIVPLGNGPALAIRFRLEVNARPVVTITAPAEGASVPAGSPVTLTGAATDAEQGDVSSLIVWRSNRLVDPIGTGARVTATLPLGRHTISASVTDGAGGTSTATRTVYVSVVSVPATLNVPYGGTASLPITLSEPAPAGGLALTVTTADAERVGVQTATVTVPAGQQSANAVLRGVAPGSAAVTVTSGEYGAVTAQVSVTAELRIVESSVSFPQGRSATLTVRLESAGAGIAAPAGGLQVTLTSAAPACAAVTSPVTIAEGLVQTTTPATVTYGGTAPTPCSAAITASLAGVPSVTSNSATAYVGSEPALTFANTYGATIPVGAGLRHQNTSQYVNLGAPAPAGGVTVTLASSDPARAVVAAGTSSALGQAGAGSVAVTVPAGQSYLYYAVDGIEGKTGSVSVTASAPGYQGATLPVAVRPLAVQLATSAATTSLSPNGYVYGYVCYANEAATAAEGCGQLVRPGGQARTLTFTSTDPAVGRLVVTGGSAGASVTSTVAVGQNTTPTNPAADGAVTFDPVGAGATTVRVTSPGAVSGASASQVVTVSAPMIGVANLPAQSPMVVGGGLRRRAELYGQYVQLGAPAPAGGLTLTLTSADPGKALVALGAGEPLAAGAGTATFTVPAGQSSARFAVDGVEGQTGTTSVTFSAPGYESATYGVALRRLAASMSTQTAITTLSPNSPVYAQLCAANAAATGQEDCNQPIRPGGQARTLTFANSDAAVGRLAVTGGATGQSVTATIDPGQTSTPSNPAAPGAVTFDPLGAGTTTVSVTSPGVVTGASASQLVTVTAPAITFGGAASATAAVGAGMRYAPGGARYIQLGAPAPAGGLALTLTSADPSRVVVAATTGSTLGAGAGSATVTVPQGSSAVYAWAADGVEGQTGTVAVTASAPGYQSARLDVSLRRPALSLSAQTTTTTLSPNTYVVANLCFADEGGTGLAGCGQPVRPGGQSRTLTFANSNAGVGQLAVTGGASGQSVTATIDPGETATSSNLAQAGAVAFDPAAPGTTTVSVTSAGALSGSSASQAITVTAPALSFYAPSGTSVAVGQTSPCVYVNLGAPAPAGTTLTLTSSAGSVLRLASGACGGPSAGPSASLAVPLAAGQQTAYVTVVGGPGTGTVVITASAPGYTNGTLSFTVTP